MTEEKKAEISEEERELRADQAGWSPRRLVDIATKMILRCGGGNGRFWKKQVGAALPQVWQRTESVRGGRLARLARRAGRVQEHERPGYRRIARQAQSDWDEEKRKYFIGRRAQQSLQEPGRRFTASRHKKCCLLRGIGLLLLKSFSKLPQGWEL